MSEFFKIDNFYPTPPQLIAKMLEGIDIRRLVMMNHIMR